MKKLGGKQKKINAMDIALEKQKRGKGKLLKIKQN